MFEKDKANNAVKELVRIMQEEVDVTKRMIIAKIKATPEGEDISEELQKDIAHLYKSIEVKFLCYFRTKFNKNIYITRLDNALRSPFLALGYGTGNVEVWTPSFLSALAVFALTGTQIDDAAFMNMNRYTHLLTEGMIQEIRDAVE